MADIQSNIKFNIDTAGAMASIKALQGQISAFQMQMSKGSSAQAREAKNLQRTLIDNVNSAGKFNASLATVKTTTESFTGSLEKNKLSMREYFRYAGGASKSFGRFFKSEFDTIGKVARERVKDLQTQYIKLGRDANGAMQAIKIRPLMLDLDNLQTKTAIAAQKQALLNQLLKQGSTNLLNFGKNTQWAGRQLMVGFSIPLGIMGSVAVKSFMEMEKQTIKFRRVYGDLSTTMQESDAMVGTIKTLASEFTKYGVSFKDTMGLAADAAAMGATGTDLIRQVTETNRLAVLGNVGQSDALQTTTSLMNAFAISSENLGEKINFLNAVENQTVTSIEDLTIAIPKAGPVVKQLGGDVEDLAFFLTAMREGGINASEGANALKSGLASLINPTATASKFMGQFGINIKQIVDSNKGDVKGLIIDVATALDTLDPLNRSRAIEQMFGKFQFARMSTLFQNVIAGGSQANRVLELTAATATELGMLAGQELKKLSDSPMYKFQQAVANIQAQLAPVGEEFLKAITPIINFGTKILDAFNNLETGTKQFIINFVGIVGGIGPILLMTFGLIANGAANIIKLFALMKNGFNKLGKGSQDLASQTQYMTNEQVEAAAIASSLDQAHNKLRQTFTLEAGALNQLTAAYQRNIAASGMRPVVPMRGKKFASGGMIMGPGTGTSDSIPAMVSNGEYITNAKQTKKYFPLLQAISQNKVPGYASPDGGSLVNLKGYTNAVHFTSPEGNADTFNPKDLSSELRAGGGKAFSPIVHEIARQLGGTSQAEIDKILNNNPNLVDMATKANNAIADELSTQVGKMDQSTYSKIWQKHLRKQAQELGNIQQEALERVLTQVTTVEDKLHLRQRGKGTIEPRGRVGIIAGTPAYRDQTSAYLRTADRFPSGVLPSRKVLAHGTGPKYGTLGEFSAGKELSGNGRGLEALASSRMTSIGIRGRSGGSVIVSNAELEQIKQEVGGSLTAAVNKILEQVKNGVRQITKTASPSKEAANVGKDIGRGFINGAQSEVANAKAIGTQLGNALVGGVSGTARRAQAAQGSYMPAGTQSGGRRRAKAPGDLEARQAAQAAAMASSGNALSGKSKKQLKSARMKVAYNNVKSGKTQIGGKLTGAGFGIGAVAGTAAMFAPPEMQGMLGTISMASSFIGMFGGAISKIVPMLLRFAGPIGIAITAIGAIAWIFGEIDKAAKERIKNEQALSNAVKMSAEGIKGAADFFGVTAKERIGSNAGVSTNAGITGARSSVAQELLKNTEFKKDNAKQIDALKRLKGADAERALAGMAADFSSLGFGEEAVQAMIDAMVIAAGKTDVSLKFKSINVATKKGRAGQVEELKKIVADAERKANTSATELEDTPGVPEAYRKTLQRTGTEMQALYTAGKLVGNQLSALQESFNDGTISVAAYQKQHATLMKILKTQKPENRFTVIQAAIKSMNPEMAKFTQHIKDANILAKVLSATMLGIEIPARTMELLGRDIKDAKSVGEATAISEANKYLDTLIAGRTKALKITEDGSNTDTSGGDTSGGATAEAGKAIQARLTLIGLQEERINKKYEERREALEKIKEVQAQISAQQRDQLDLADALTRGDIAGAARAAQQMRANNATKAIENQQKAMDTSQKAEVSALVDPKFGKSKTYLENVLQQQEIAGLYKTIGMKAPSFNDPIVPSATIPSSSGTSVINNNVSNSSPVYNINVSTNSNASPAEIASIVVEKIKTTNSQKLQGSRLE